MSLKENTMLYSDKLYRLAFDFYDIAPWKKIRDAQLFAFHSQTFDSTMYCSITGTIGALLGLTVYTDVKGLQFLYDLSTHSHDVLTNFLPGDGSYSTMLINAVQCIFTDHHETFPEQMQALKAYADKYHETYTGKQDIPTFYNVLPFRQPFSLHDPERLKVLEEALSAFMVFDREFGPDYEEIPLLSPASPVTVPLLIPDGSHWRIVSHKLPAYEPEYQLDTIPFTNDILLQKLRRLPRLGSVDCMLTVMPTAVAEEDTAVFAEALILYCREKSFFAPPALDLRARGEEDAYVWSRILNQFARDTLPVHLKALPNTIYYNGQRTFCVLYDLCIKLHINLIAKEKMPELEHLIQNMAQSLYQEGGGEFSDNEALLLPLLSELEKLPSSALYLMPDEAKAFLRSVNLKECSPPIAERLKKLLKRLS
ncbi:MAG: hypothetical protein IJ242_17510 [Clostridia bacterium]|nr:hypothetical protein [Clostridia bacterium]